MDSKRFFLFSLTWKLWELKVISKADEKISNAMTVFMKVDFGAPNKPILDISGTEAERAV